MGRKIKQKKEKNNNTCEDCIYFKAEQLVLRIFPIQRYLFIYFKI